MDAELKDLERTFGVELEGIIDCVDNSGYTNTREYCDHDCLVGCDGYCTCDELRDELCVCGNDDDIECEFCENGTECSYCRDCCDCPFCQGECDCQVCIGECEYCLDNQNDGESSRDDLASYISRMANVDCRAEGWNTDSKHYWKVISDASINPDSGIDIEVVSPSEPENLLSGANGLKDVYNVVEAMREYGVTINSSAGLHVHHCTGRSKGADLELKPFAFANLIKLYAFYEGILDSLQPRSRRGRNPSYLASVKSHYGNLETAKELALQVDRILENYPESSISETVTNLAKLCGRDRYCKINIMSFFKHGTVEFRHHAGTTDPDKVTAWIELTQNILSYCNRRQTRITEHHVPCFAKLMQLIKARPELISFYKDRREHFKNQYETLTAFCTNHKRGYNEEL